LECVSDSTRIWSIIQCPYEEFCIYPGEHSCNNVGYVVTEKEWEHENIQVDHNNNLTVEEAINEAKNIILELKYELKTAKLISHIISIFEGNVTEYISMSRLYFAIVHYLEDITGEDIEDEKFLDKIRIKCDLY